MEIPIQLAVRISPWANSVNNYSDALNQNENIVDANGNNGNGADLITTTTTEKKLLDNERNHNEICVQALSLAANGAAIKLDNGIATGLIQAGPHNFPVTHALPMNCSQTQVYHQTVLPLIALLLEGYDASVVTYGQRKSGKTYTLYGLGFDCTLSEADQGIVQRCVREIFAFISQHNERTYAVSIGFVEIYGEMIRDLLGVGNVSCKSVAEVFQWLQIGLNTKAKTANENLLTHTLFTLTLEQQWLTKDGVIQHRLSTASFSDLCATERIFLLEKSTNLPKDLGLQALEHIVNTLTDPQLLYNMNGNVPYTQTTLTTLLKDSFGGRAQTLIVLCISPLREHLAETLCNLQFGFKAQCVRNYVIMNTFSDDNTQIPPDIVANDLRVNNASLGLGNGNDGVGINIPGLPLPNDNFGLQFAASQWFKLVSNAEGLFSKLVESNALSPADKEQIEEWLFLKQECEECLSSSEALRSQKQLGPIQETDEPDDTISENENSYHQNTDNDNDSDSESQRPDIDDKMDSLMEDLRTKTDSLALAQHEEFMARQPKPVMESHENFHNSPVLQQQGEAQSPSQLQEEEKERNQSPPPNDDRRVSVGGRRRSIQPGSTLSSAEIAMLNRVASCEPRSKHTNANNGNDEELDDDLLDPGNELQHVASPLRGAGANYQSPIDTLIRKLRKLDTDIECRERQIKELEKTIQIKQNIISELVKNSETRSNAKQRFNKKKNKLEAEYEKNKKQLIKALIHGKDKGEVERLRASIDHLEQRLEDLTSMKHIAGESGQKMKKLHQSVQESKKIIEDLQKKLKKERKLQDQLESELKALREKENTKALVKPGYEHDDEHDEIHHGKQLKEVQSRISHLDHVLKEKSDNLEQYGETEEKEGLRHEIRNLRRTRDHLIEQRCTLDRKLKRDKMLSQREERKLLECDEAIEAIDAAIEFKNELICGHKSIDTSDRIQREKGEQMLMARLNKLSSEEMRTLLYKYFTKVIDLRTSSLKLENQLIQLERERDAWEWKERVLSNAVRQARLEGERNAVLLQRQHEMKLTLMLRHFAEETSASSSLASEQGFNHPSRYMRPMNLNFQPHQTLSSPTTTTPTTPTASDSEFDLDFYKYAGANNGGKLLKNHKHSEMEMCPLPDALAKYKPLDKYKEKERESKNKLFAKFQVLTRYAGQAVNMSESESQLGPSASSSKKKDKDVGAIAAAAGIPQENLKILKSSPSATKVTRQKNKIIIQNATRK